MITFGITYVRIRALRRVAEGNPLLGRVIRWAAFVFEKFSLNDYSSYIGSLVIKQIQCSGHH